MTAEKTQEMSARSVYLHSRFRRSFVLLTNELQQTKEVLELVESEASKVGLHLNAKKTEVMFNRDQASEKTSISSAQSWK